MVTQPPLPVLLTRPRAQSEQFARTLPDTLRPVISPLLRIEYLAGFEPAPRGTTLIFTSANGVQAYAERFPGSGMPALCVGARTAETARAAGFDAISADGDAAAVIALSVRLGGPFVHVRGRHAVGDITARLRAAGQGAKEIIAYDQLPVPLSRAAFEALHGPCLVPLFSPRTADLFAAACPEARSAMIFAMSLAVAERLSSLAYNGIIAIETPNAAAMRDALLAYAAGNRLEAGKSSG
jgi:uroporphyrinogen-III synthase